MRRRGDEEEGKDNENEKRGCRKYRKKGKMVMTKSGIRREGTE